jgi:hypothetical protein
LLSGESDSIWGDNRGLGIEIRLGLGVSSSAAGGFDAINNPAHQSYIHIHPCCL